MSTENLLLCCPECKGTRFRYDLVHCETVCLTCGLVLLADYPGIFPGYMIIEKDDLN